MNAETCLYHVRETRAYNITRAQERIRAGESARDERLLIAVMDRILEASNAASPEPVPATNQAGEVERRVKDLLRGPDGEEYTDSGMEGAFFRWPVVSQAILAALATQPATSQDGNVIGDAGPQDCMWRSGHDGEGPDPSRFFCDVIGPAPLCHRYHVVADTETEARIRAFRMADSTFVAAEPAINDIVLVSQDSEPGYQLHGLFSSFSDAADHAAKDEDNEHTPVWVESQDRQQWVTARTVWVASRQPIRNALSTQPATSQEGEIAQVERIETVPLLHPFDDTETPPIWRVQVGEQCADFDYETAARNFAAAINAATPTPPTLSEGLREAAERCDPVLRDKPSVKVMANLLELGAEHQRPRSKQYSRGEHNSQADAMFIVAAIKFATAALAQVKAS